MNYDGMRVCNVPDHLGNVGCMWPFVDVTVYAEGVVGQVKLADAMELALPAWNDVSGIRLSMTANRKTAHIAVGVGQIDGPGNILAQNELPCGFTANRWQQLRGEYDLSEAVVISDNPPGNKIDIVRVCRHEIGHGVGIQHIGSGNLMAPIYSASISLPQNGDITEARARYGPPSPVSVPPVSPSTPATPSFPTGSTIFTALQFALELFAKLTPAERGKVWDLILGLVRSLTPAERVQAEALLAPLGIRLPE